jgi:large subunit ribosomal protein L24
VNKVKKGDIVKIISGSETGKSGEVLSVYPDSSTVVVKGVAVAKRHKRGNERGSGEIVEREMPIHWSKVMLLVDDAPSKVGFSIKKDSKKERVFEKRS